MQLIIITTEELFPDEARIVNSLLALGNETWHLRKPYSSVTEMRGLLAGIDSRFHRRIVLHEHFRLMAGFNLKGIHLNRRNPLPVGTGDGQKNSLYSVGKSCHSIDELNHTGAFDYMFLSPVFDSISKTGYSRAFDDRQLCDARQRGLINQQVFALGGISAETIPAAAVYGFGGVAALGALWGNYAKDKDEAALAGRLLQLQQVCVRSRINCNKIN
jgi:thiamine-phosphate pyrophosphorylase